jgi:SAM-dependent methyltransferase
MDKENRSAPPAFAVRETPGSDRHATRRAHIFSGTAMLPGADKVLLEIGPAHNGTLKKKNGFNVRIADYLDRAGLVKKYSSFTQYNMDDIEDVDYILIPGSPLSKSIADRFDIVLASHVIEHSISLVDFINDLGALLKPGGHVALIIPDKRFCFDRFRERTSLCSVIDRIGTDRKVHSAGTRAEFSINAVKHRGTPSWATQHVGDYSFIYSTKYAREQADSASSQHYHDVHNWVFTPHHFRLMMHDLAELGYTSLREKHFHTTIHNEFFMNLSTDGQGPGLSRSELLSLSEMELRTLDVPTWAT